MLAERLAVHTRNLEDACRESANNDCTVVHRHHWVTRLLFSAGGEVARYSRGCARTGQDSIRGVVKVKGVRVAARFKCE